MRTQPNDPSFEALTNATEKQTGGEVWRLADHTALLRGTRADQIANDDEASGDADPHVQRLLCGEPADRVDDRQPGASRALGIVLMRLR